MNIKRPLTFEITGISKNKKFMWQKMVRQRIGFARKNEKR